MNTTMNIHSRHVWVFTLGLIVAACVFWWLASRTADAEEQPATGPQVATSTTPPETTGADSISRDELPVVVNHNQKPLPNSFEEMLSRYSPEQQRILRSFYNSYNDAMMQFSTPEQLAWLKRRGFPMPEDVLAGQLLSTEQLNSLAKSGDAKAAALLSERLMQTFTADPAAYFSSPQTVLIWQNEPRVIAGGSPFGGYFHARLESFKAEVQYPDEPQRVAKLTNLARVVGWEWAQMLGDRRTVGDAMEDARRSYFVAAKSLDGEGADLLPLSEFKTLLLMAVSENPRVFEYRRDVWPKAPVD